MHQPAHHTSKQLEHQQQNARTNALGQLQSQRLQRAEQRLHSRLQGSADADMQHDQLARSSMLQTNSQMRLENFTQKGPKQPDQQQAAHEIAALQGQGHRKQFLSAPTRQHPSASSVRCITTTAGRGMHSIPPTRAGSVRNSLELQQMHPSSMGMTRGGCDRNALTTAAVVAGHAGKYRGASETMHSQQLMPPLHVQGVQFQMQQQQHTTQAGLHSKPPPAHAAVRKHNQHICAVQMMLACSKHGRSTRGTSLQLGCGVAWGDVATQAALVANKSLHHTKRERDQQRLLLARLVVQQWAWFTHDRQQTRMAVQHHNKQLLAAGWLGLQRELSQQQLLLCQANLQAQKHSFMLLSRCFVAWRQQWLQLQHQASVVAEMQARRNRQTAAGAMLGWQQLVDKGRMRQQLLLRSEAYRTLVIMSRGLQAWRAWLTDRQLQRLKDSRASQHWQSVLQRHVVACWQQRVADSAAKWHKLASALCFHKHKLQAVALQTWQLVVREQQQTKAQAVLLLQQWQQQQQLQTIRMALRCWQQIAQQQLEWRQLSAQLMHILQQQLRRHVLQHWHRITQYHRRLGAAAGDMAGIADWWWLLHCMDRWHSVVAAMAGRRSAELRELVLLRAVLGTWLKHTEQRCQRKAALAAATAALQQRRLQRMLAAWQAASDALAAKHQQQKLAAQHHVQHTKCRLLLRWRDAAAKLAVEREQAAVADQKHYRWLMARTLQGWSWYCWHSKMKQQVPEFYRAHLLLQVLLSWRHITTATLLEQQRWRQAERHHRLATLAQCISCWQCALQAAARQQQRILSAKQQYTRQLQLQALRAWLGPFMAHQRHKQAQLGAAAAQHATQLQRNAIQQLRTHVAAQKAERAAMLIATGHMQSQLLSKALTTWAAVCDAAAAERQQLADAAAPAIAALGNSRKHRLLAAWRHLVLIHQQEQLMEGAASAHRRHILLHKSLTAWQQYSTQRTYKATAKQLAQQHWQARMGAGVLSCWQRHMTNSAVKRQHMFAAAMHRRRWLARRAWRSWRLALALTKLEHAAPHIAQQDGAATDRAGTEIQGEQPFLDAVAAAVVAASCTSQASGQKRWQQEQQHSSSSTALSAEQHLTEQEQQQQWSPELAACTCVYMPQWQQVQQQQHGQQLQENQGLGVAALPPAASSLAKRPRRPPRLPAFMQSEQQQQRIVRSRTKPSIQQPRPPAQNEEGQCEQKQRQGTVLCEVTTSVLQQRQQQQQLPEQCIPWELHSCLASAKRHALHQQQHHRQQPLQTAYVSRTAADTDTCRDATHTGRYASPQVHRVRLQPRQLQPSLVGCVAPVSMRQQHHQQYQPAPPLQGSCGQDCDSSKSILTKLQQEQEQHRLSYASHDVQLLVVQHEAQAVAGKGLGEPGNMPAGGLSSTTADREATPTGLSSSVAGLQGSPTPAAAAVASGYASMLQYRPAPQQQLDMPCLAVNRWVLPQQHLQPLQEQLQAATADHTSVQVPYTPLNMQVQHLALGQAAATGSSSRQMPYTPMTRQLLQEEVQAMERALQLMAQLKTALQCRQQQAAALQHQIALLCQQAGCSTPAPLMNAIGGTQQVGDANIVLAEMHSEGVQLQHTTQMGVKYNPSNQQQHVLQEQLQGARRQLIHVELELSELRAEQDRQQPRLAAIADRIQQLKEAALSRQQQHR